MTRSLLRYSITDWHQLPAAKSNNSAALHAKVVDLIQNEDITGLCISVYHDTMGTLFACLLHASGSAITPGPSGLPTELTTQEILDELYKFGFVIEYNQSEHLPSTQVEFLRSLLSLNYDKLRLLAVRNNETARTLLVAFNVETNPKWLDNTYVASEKEFTLATANGTAMNLTDATRHELNKWDWGWLTYVANIQDILDEQE